jgi:hypothetical protein
MENPPNILDEIRAGDGRKKEFVSCPYAGMTRIRLLRVTGLPALTGISAPCRGTPWNDRHAAADGILESIYE